MSLGRPNSGIVLTPEAYQVNKIRIEEARAYLEQWEAQNEEGRRNHEQMARELEEKVREGEEAKRMLETLRQRQPDQQITISPPSTAASNKPIAQPNIGVTYGVNNGVASSSRIEEISVQTHQEQRQYHRPPNVTRYGDNSGAAYMSNGPTQSNVAISQRQRLAEQVQSVQGSSSHVPPKPSSEQTAINVNPIFRVNPQSAQQVPNSLYHQSVAMSQQQQLAQQLDKQQQSSLASLHTTNNHSRTSVAQASTSGNTLKNKSQATLNRYMTTGSSSVLQPASNSVNTTRNVDSHVAEMPVHSGRMALPAKNFAMSSSNAPVNNAPTALTMTPNNDRVPVHLSEEQLQRFKEIIDSWERVSPPNSYFHLPHLHFRVFKNQHSITSILVPSTVEGKFLHVKPVDFSNKHIELYYKMYSKSSDQPTTNTSNISLNTASSVANAVSQQSLPSTYTTMQNGSSPVVEQSRTPISGVLRPPSQVDKKHLARDVLRALSTPNQKRNRDEATLANDNTPSAKRHASDQNVLSALAVPQVPNSIPEVSAALPKAANSANSVASPYFRQATNSNFNPQVAIPNTAQFTPTANVLLRSGPATSIQPQASPSTHKEPIVDPQVSLVKEALPPFTPQITFSARMNPVTPSQASQIEEVVDTNSDVKMRSPSPLVNRLIPSQVPQSSSDIRSISTPAIRLNPSPKKTPLFLPSPSTSPAPQSPMTGRSTDAFPPESADEFSVVNFPTSVHLKERKNKERQQVYILLPSRPEYVKRDLARLQRIREKRKRVEDGSHSKALSEVGSNSDELQIVGEKQRSFFNDDTEREATQISATRLHEVECKWDGCDVVMNSVEGLIMHLNTEHKLLDEKPFMCLWQQCGKRCAFEDTYPTHIERHALSPLHCAFEGCGETFRRPGQLVQHNLMWHRNGVLKPNAHPIKPVLGPLPALPHSLPSYMTIARDVRQAPMAHSRHNIICPWVRKNISGPVYVTGKYNAASPSRAFKQRALISPGVFKGNYSFLNPELKTNIHSSILSREARIPALAYMDSFLVSRRIEEGMTLFGPIQNEEKAERSAGAEQIVDIINLNPPVNEEVKIEDVEVGIPVLSPAELRDHRSNVDEDAVEDLLTYPSNGSA